MQKSSVESEIFNIFQHKVERIPHFARISEVRHIYFLSSFRKKSYSFNDLFSLRSFRGILSKTKLSLSDINPPTFLERFKTLKSNLVLRAINGNFRGTNYYIESCNYSQQTRSPYSTLCKRGYTPYSGSTLCSARDV